MLVLSTAVNENEKYWNYWKRVEKFTLLEWITSLEEMAWAIILSVVPAAFKTFPVKQKAWNWTAYSSCCRETAALLDASVRWVCRTACVAAWQERCTHSAFPGSPPSPQQQTRICGAHHRGICSLEAGASSVCQLAMQALIKVLFFFQPTSLGSSAAAGSCWDFFSWKSKKFITDEFYLMHRKH